jgi:SH2 domain-containing protein 4A
MRYGILFVLSGIISRVDAEKLLEEQEMGAFVVRVSERVWGYTISYKEKSRVKHFLIDATDLGYQFFGANQVIHKSLAELVAFHKVMCEVDEFVCTWCRCCWMRQ